MFGQDVLQDDPSEPLNTTWLESPGARVEPVCGSDDVALHFRGDFQLCCVLGIYLTCHQLVY